MDLLEIPQISSACAENAQDMAPNSRVHRMALGAVRRLDLTKHILGNDMTSPGATK